MTHERIASAAQAFDLLSNPERDRTAYLDPQIRNELSRLKAEAVARGEQREACLIWQAEAIADIQRDFADAFRKLKACDFYNAWCELERCEIHIHSLRRHHKVAGADPHRIQFIEQMIERWQGLFPYKVFFSPEILKKKVVCSICDAVVTPRSDCGHQKGKVYDGQLCLHRIVEAEILGLSIVDNPVQRYSVAFLVDEDGNRRDHYNYGNVKFVADRVSSPWHEWRAVQTTRTLSKADVPHVRADAPCPCLSGDRFGKCCAGKETLVVPHLQIEFSVNPPSNLPENEILF